MTPTISAGVLPILLSSLQVFIQGCGLQCTVYSLAVLERVEGVVELDDRRHLAVKLHHAGFFGRGLIFGLPVLDRLRTRRL